MPLGIDFTQIFLHLLNVTILFAGLYVLLYSPVKKFMEKREQHYKDLDEQANTKIAEADKLKAEYAEKLDKAEAEINEMRDQASVEVRQIRDKAEFEAKENANKIITEAKKEAEKQKKSIVTGAKDEITRMVEKATKKVALSGSSSEAFDKFLDDAERS